MYTRIEEKYKKYSVYNKFIKYYFKTFLILYLLFVINGFFQKPDYLYFMFIVFIIVLYKKVLKELKLPFRYIFRFKDIKQNLMRYRQYLNQEESKLIVKIAKSENIKTKAGLTIVINHYRELSNLKIKSSGYWNALALVITLFVAFKDVTELTFESLEQSFVFLFSIMMIFTILYFCYKQIEDLIDIFKGRKNIYNNLEEAFIELYFKKQ